MALASGQSLSYPKVNVRLTHNIYFRALYKQNGLVFVLCFFWSHYVCDIHILDWTSGMFLCIPVYYSLERIYNWVIHSLLDGHSDCFQFRVIKNNAAFSILVCLWVHRCMSDKHVRVKLLWHKYKCS